MADTDMKLYAKAKEIFAREKANSPALKDRTFDLEANKRETLSATTITALTDGEREHYLAKAKDELDAAK